MHNIIICKIYNNLSPTAPHNRQHNKKTHNNNTFTHQPHLPHDDNETLIKLKRILYKIRYQRRGGCGEEEHISIFFAEKRQMTHLQRRPNFKANSRKRREVLVPPRLHHIQQLIYIYIIIYTGQYMEKKETQQLNNR